MPNLSKQNFPLFLIVVIGTLLLAFIIKNLFYGSESIGILTPRYSRQDFELSDFYETVRHNRTSVTPRMSVVHVVPSDNLTREEICDVLISIKNSQFKPAVIGIDLVFEKEQKKDSILIRTINELGNVVLPTILEKDSDVFSYSGGSYFVQEKLGGFHHGAINLPSYSDMIRSFQPRFEIGQGYEYCFASSIVTLYCESCFDFLESRHTQSEIISFPNFNPEDPYCSIHILDDIDNLDCFLETAKDEIVLIGDIQSFSDTHTTPIGNRIPGVLIHASIIDMITSYNYINRAPNWLCILISIFFAIVATIMLLLAKNYFPNSGNLIFRAFQILVIIALGIIGTLLYVNGHYYIDNIEPIIIIAISSLTFDIVYGLIGIINRCRHED